MSEQLDIVLGDSGGDAVLIAGKTLHPQPIKLNQVSRVAKLSLPMTRAIFSGDLESLLVEHTDAIIELAALLSGESPEWVGDLPLDESLTLISKLIEVNRDFFVRRVLPLVIEMMGRMAGPSKSIGTTTAESATAPDQSTAGSASSPT